MSQMLAFFRGGAGINEASKEVYPKELFPRKSEGF